MKLRLIKVILLIVIGSIAILVGFLPCFLGEKLSSDSVLFSPLIFLAPVMFPLLLPGMAYLFWPCRLFLLELLVCCGAFVFSRVSARLVLIPAILFAALPYIISTASRTGGEPWRYQLMYVFVFIGLVETAFFVVYCWQASRR